MKQVRQIADAPEGIGIAMIGVPPGSAIDLDVTLEAVVEGVLVTGTAEVGLGDSAHAAWRRSRETPWWICKELYLYPGKEVDDEEASRIEDEMIDLEPLLRDAVVLDLPFTPLCRPDCAGLCPTCGVNLNREPEHSHDDTIDSRWAGLAGWTQA